MDGGGADVTEPAVVNLSHCTTCMPLTQTAKTCCHDQEVS